MNFLHYFYSREVGVGGQMSTQVICLGGFCPVMPFFIGEGGGGGANVPEGLCPYTGHSAT